MALCNPAKFFFYSLILLAILHLQTPPYQNRVVAIFSPCMYIIYGCHFEFKMSDLYSDGKIKLKSMSSCSCDHKDSKNVRFSIMSDV